MATEFCPFCHQSMSDTVAGIRLPIVKIRLFRFIESHPGQTSLELGQHFSKKPETIRAHILQINEAMMDTCIRIIGGKFTGYYIEKRIGGNCEQANGSQGRARGR